MVNHSLVMLDMQLDMQKEKWLDRPSGLAIIKITVVHKAHSLIPNFDNLVEYLVRNTVPDDKIQADFSTNPFQLSNQDERGNRHLRILANSAAKDVACWKLLQELRLYVKDYGGKAADVLIPDVYYNLTHGVILAKGFNIAEYDAWARHHCPLYKPPYETKISVQNG